MDGQSQESEQDINVDQIREMLACAGLHVTSAEAAEIADRVRDSGHGQTSVRRTDSPRDAA